MSTTPNQIKAAKAPDTNRINFAAPVDFMAAAGEGKRPTFTIAAYTGSVMSVGGFYTPVIVDLGGLKAARQTIPILLDHDTSKIIGQSSEVKVSSSGVQVAGSVTGDDADAAKVTTHAKNGFQWQASIGATIIRREFLEAGKKARVNGRDVSGPLMIAREAELHEVSFVAIGADQDTSASLAAQRGFEMNFLQWLEAKGFDVSTLGDVQKATLQAAFDAEQRGKGGNPPSPGTDSDLESVLAAGQANRARIGQIAQITASALNDHPGRSQEIEALSRVAANGNWAPEKYELELLRATRTAQVQPWRNGGRDEPAGDVVECALAGAVGVKNLDKHYSDRTLEAAGKRFRHGIGLKEVLLMAARANGEYHDVGTRNIKALLRAAFPSEGAIRAAGFTSLSLPNVFSNVANKVALDAFNAVESTHMRIASITNVGDFKQTTSIALTGDLKFEKIGPTGELKQGTLGEEVYHNQADSYGKLVGLDRRDIINDDAGALNRVPKRLGRGGALALVEEFWTVFLNNGAFFTGARGNYDDGTDSAFDAAGLTAADMLFRAIEDPDGKPMGSMPAILLVPPKFRIPALRLMNSQQTHKDSDAGSDNPWAGAFRVESSVYMANSSFIGYSADAWFLLSDPADVPVVEIAFLDGRQFPVVDTAEPTADYLGVLFPAYFDFGVSLQEHRGGVKLKGTV